MSVEPLVRLPDGARYLLRPSTVRAIFVDESGETMVDRGKGYQINMGERPVEEVAALLGIPVVEPERVRPMRMRDAEDAAMNEYIDTGRVDVYEPTAEDIKGPPELDVWEPVSSFDVRVGDDVRVPWGRRAARIEGKVWGAPDSRTVRLLVEDGSLVTVDPTCDTRWERKVPAPKGQTGGDSLPLTLSTLRGLVRMLPDPDARVLGLQLLQGIEGRLLPAAPQPPPEGWAVVSETCLVRHTPYGPEYTSIDGGMLTCKIGGEDHHRLVPAKPAHWLTTEAGRRQGGGK